MTGTVLAIHDRLLAHYGPQGWWPADTAFEMMIGAILTQNTSWTNVERAIAGLKQAGLVDAAAIAACDTAGLAAAIRPSGYYNQKAQRLQAFARFYLDHAGECGGDHDGKGGVGGLAGLAEPRQALLALHGIGPETADSMLLYALGIPVFVIDAYTRRVFARLGLTAPDATYPVLQHYFQTNLPASVPLFREYHALIVMHAKQHCRSRPVCTACPLLADCAHGASFRQAATTDSR